MGNTRKRKIVRSESTNAIVDEHQNTSEVKRDGTDVIAGELTAPDDDSSIHNKIKEERNEDTAANPLAGSHFASSDTDTRDDEARNRRQPVHQQVNTRFSGMRKTHLPQHVSITVAQIIKIRASQT